MIGDITKHILNAENYAKFKQLMINEQEVHPFEIPAIGYFTTAAVVKAFLAENNITDNAIAAMDDAQKLFITK